VLSDPARRKRYDETGSTSESIVDSEGFNWSDYYREQFKDAVSTDAIEKFAKQYKGSDEEKDDILAAFELHEGDLDGVYEMVILSDVLEDDERFREIIDEAIKKKEVPNFKVYNSESTKKRQQRLQKARKEAAKEAKEAEEYAKELGVHDKLYNNHRSQDKGTSKGKSKTSKDSSEDALAALIQKRQQDRSGAGFLDRIAEKYGATSTGKKGKKRASPPDEPPEEMFQAAEAKYRAKKGAESKSGLSSGKRARR
jgi:DnaJ family protein C protein 9